MDDAIIQVERWIESPSLHLLGEDAFFETLRPVVKKSNIRGPAVHDARIAAIYLRHGITKLLTADRDFSRFSQLRTQNPLLDAPQK